MSWGCGTTLTGAYCRPCDAYTALGEPCWLCGATDLKPAFAPTSGWHHDPTVQCVPWGNRGSIEVEP